MSTGMDQLQVSKEVGASGIIDMKKLCGLYPNDPRSEEELASAPLQTLLMLQQGKGFEIFGWKQQRLLEAPEDA